MRSALVTKTKKWVDNQENCYFGLHTKAAGCFLYAQTKYNTRFLNIL